MKLSYWKPKIVDMLNQYEDAYKTEVRPKALWYLISQKYPELNDKERHIEMIKDIEYISRLMRRLSEEKQQPLKRKLETNYVKELYKV